MSTQHMNDSGLDERSPEVQARRDYADGLRAMANWIEETPGAPLPNTRLARHYDDADEFDAAARVLATAITGVGGRYEHCERSFGVVVLAIQTDGREAQHLRRREERLAARERELGFDS